MAGLSEHKTSLNFSSLKASHVGNYEAAEHVFSTSLHIPLAVLGHSGKAKKLS